MLNMPVEQACTPTDGTFDKENYDACLQTFPSVAFGTKIALYAVIGMIGVGSLFVGMGVIMKPLKEAKA